MEESRRELAAVRNLSPQTAGSLPHSFDTPAAGIGGSTRAGSKQAKREEVETDPDETDSLSDDPEVTDEEETEEEVPIAEWKPYDSYRREGDPKQFQQQPAGKGKAGSNCLAPQSVCTLPKTRHFLKVAW
jgi:hypothetical protein